MTRSFGGWTNGFLGVLIFSGSLPATRVAVAALDPIFLTTARAAVAGLLGLALLLTFQQPRPSRGDILSVAVVAIGVVIGFPLLSALALRYVTSAHATVFIGLLPLATAVFGVIRAGERPPALFWAFAVAGSALVVGFALRNGLTVAPAGDLLMVAAVLLCGLGYAEGGRLARRLGGWQVVSWALVLALPISLPLAFVLLPADLGSVPAPAWLGFAYVSLFSMLIGFIFWYRGLAEGGIAAVGQLQLLQPFMSLVIAAGLLGETIDATMLAVTLGVVLCVAAAKGTAGRTPSPPASSAIPAPR